MLTARSIAMQCGIFMASGVIMEGSVFRLLDDSQMLKIVPHLQVLTRLSPEDKKILVEKLRALGVKLLASWDWIEDERIDALAKKQLCNLQKENTIQNHKHARQQATLYCLKLESAREMA